MAGMSEDFSFSVRKLFWFTTLIAIWCGAWHYMANALFNYGPHRHVSFFPFLGCFIVTCVTTTALLRSLMTVKSRSRSLGIVIFIWCVIFNAFVFCIVASRA